MYIHELPTWPVFHWDEKVISDVLARVRHKQGRLSGRMEALGFELRQEATLQALTEEATKSSEIEGEKLDRDQVRSSIARHLGMDIAGLVPSDRNIDGIVEMMLDATQNYQKPLSAARLFGWHAALFPTGYSGLLPISVGTWRQDKAGPMQVVSGPYGRETVHYQAPPAAKVDEEMQAYLTWLNAPSKTDPVLKAAISHLWFVTIHPLDDGNGRIARAIADMGLSRSEDSAQRFYSLSSHIRNERRDYYNILERTQKGDLDITDWLVWFLECLERAIEGAGALLQAVLDKAGYWEAHNHKPINDRQRYVLNRLLNGFEGHLTSSKWAKLTKSSQDTALRDIKDLVAKDMLVKNDASGRSTSYRLVR